MNNIPWRKSSYSTNTGPFIEVAVWRKSSYSSNAGQCVEVAAWRKSTHSTNTGQCVEVAADGGVLVRDTTEDGTGPVLSIAPAAWTAFLTTIR